MKAPSSLFRLPCGRLTRSLEDNVQAGSEQVQTAASVNGRPRVEPEAPIEHQDWTTGDVYIIDVRERVIQELRAINTNLTKEEEAFLEFSPKVGARYRVIDHIKECGQTAEEGSNVSQEPQDQSLPESMSARVKLRLKSFWNSKSVSTTIGGFFKFLEFLSGVLESALGAINSDYVIGFKIMMLIAKAFETRQERVDAIKASLEKITKLTDQLRYLQDKVRGQTMRQAIEDFFCAFALFAIRVYHYTTINWKITQLAKAMAKTDQYLDEATKRVLDCWARIESVQSTAILATSLETRGLVAAQAHFQARTHAESMIADLGLEDYNPVAALDFNDRDRRHLAPADRWLRHIRTSSVDLSPRSTNQVASVNWIWGQLARRNVSWVSSFSVDLINALKITTSRNNVAHIFCKHGLALHLHPLDLLLRIIVQILRFWPELVLYHPAQIPRRRFEILKKTGADDTAYRQGSAMVAWELLRDMLRVLETSKARQGQRLLILIDRLDLCKSNTYQMSGNDEEDEMLTDFTVTGDLIYRLAELTRGSLFVSVLITAARIQGRAIKRQLAVAGHGTVEILQPQLVMP